MSWIVAGLGNPDTEYEGTRHNIGRDLIDSLRDDLPRKVKVLDLNVYMNNSGGPIKKAVTSKAAAAQLIVVHDELDLPLGRIKISFGSSAGGHNGVKSIQKALKTELFFITCVGKGHAHLFGVKERDGKRVALAQLEVARKPSSVPNSETCTSPAMPSSMRRARRAC
jgi:peptidyl-tRNA hydrolase